MSSVVVVSAENPAEAAPEEAEEVAEEEEEEDRDRKTGGLKDELQLEQVGARDQ